MNFVRLCTFVRPPLAWQEQTCDFGAASYGPSETSLRWIFEHSCKSSKMHQFLSSKMGERHGERHASPLCFLSCPALPYCDPPSPPNWLEIQALSFLLSQEPANDIFKRWVWFPCWFFFKFPLCFQPCTDDSFV